MGIPRRAARPIASCLDALWPLLAYLPESDAAARLGRWTPRVRSATSPSLSSATVPQSAAAGIRCRRTFMTRASHRCCVRLVPAGLSGDVADDASGRRAEGRCAGRSVRVAAHVSRAARRADRRCFGSLAQIGPGRTIESNDVRHDQRGRQRHRALPRDDSGGRPVADAGHVRRKARTSRSAPRTSTFPPAGSARKPWEWFDRAFRRRARTVSADLTYRGSVRDLSLPQGRNAPFLVRGHVEDALFEYPRAGSRRASITACISSSATEGTAHSRYVRARRRACVWSERDGATSPDLKETHLRIKAAARGELQDRPGVAAELSARAALGLSLRAAEPAMVRRRLQSTSICRSGVSTIARSTLPARFADATAARRHIDAARRSLQGNLTVVATARSLPRSLHGQWLGWSARSWHSPGTEPTRPR